MHVGPFAGHRTDSQTLDSLRRLAHWEGMQPFVEAAVARCWVCIQYRRRPGKILTSFCVARAKLPWHHVLIDLQKLQNRLRGVAVGRVIA